MIGSRFGLALLSTAAAATPGLSADPVAATTTTTPVASAWIHYWIQPHDVGLPSWFLFILTLILIYLTVLIPAAGLMMYLDRRLGAVFQARIGPQRVGLQGLLQPLADFLKLLQKELLQQKSWQESFWLGLYTMALYSVLAVLPLGSLALMVDTEMSAFLPFWAALVFALGTMLLGLNQGSVPGWLGGIRVAAQTLAGAFPALISLVCAGVNAGSFRWSVLAGAQRVTPWSWTALSNPFQFSAFVVFMMSGLVLLAIPPLDGGLSGPEMQGGISSSLFGRNLSLFHFGRFFGFFFWSIITVVLFLGAWALPESLRDFLMDSESYRSLILLELGCVLVKSLSLMVLVIWVARVNPRSRVDQITDFAWTVLSPFALMSLVGVTLYAGWKAHG